jgi:hypothetical protein
MAVTTDDAFSENQAAAPEPAAMVRFIVCRSTVVTVLRLIDTDSLLVERMDDLPLAALALLFRSVARRPSDLARVRVHGIGIELPLCEEEIALLLGPLGELHERDDLTVHGLQAIEAGLIRQTRSLSDATYTTFEGHCLSLSR